MVFDSILAWPHITYLTYTSYISPPRIKIFGLGIGTLGATRSGAERENLWLGCGGKRNHSHSIYFFPLSSISLCLSFFLSPAHSSFFCFYFYKNISQNHILKQVNPIMTRPAKTSPTKTHLQPIRLFLNRNRIPKKNIEIKRPYSNDDAEN